MSLSSILPTPGLDCSTSPGGQTHSLSIFSSSLAPWQAALQQVCKKKQNLHCVDNLELKARVASGDVVLFMNMFIGGGWQSSLGMAGTIGLATVLNRGSR